MPSLLSSSEDRDQQLMRADADPTIREMPDGLAEGDGQHRADEVDARTPRVSRLDQSWIHIDDDRSVGADDRVARERPVPSERPPQSGERSTQLAEVRALLDGRASAVTRADPEVRVKRDEVAVGKDGLDHRQWTRCRLLDDDATAELSAPVEFIDERFEFRPVRTKRTPLLAYRSRS